MRRRVALTTLIALLALAAPFQANAKHAFNHIAKNTFTAPTPCHVVCPYWQDAAGGGDGDEWTCWEEPPSLPGSWDDWDITLSPPTTSQEIVFLVFTIAPLVDYDSFMCRGEADPNNDTWHLVTGANTIGELCGVGGFGCPENPELTVCTTITYPKRGDGSCVEKGTPVVLRVYNWSDPAPQLAGEYFYSKTGEL